MGDANEQVVRMTKSGWWGNTMELWFGNINDYGNFTRGKKACGQFVVSRERIKSLPREFYCNMYQWLCENTIGDVNVGYNKVTKSRLSTPIDKHPNSNFYTSRYMEWTWELIFTSYKQNYKQNENINFYALYGHGKYFRNVTHIVKNFIKDNEINIPKTIKFNNLFGDTVFGVEKILIISLDGNIHKFQEKRKNDINIIINKI